MFILSPTGLTFTLEYPLWMDPAPPAINVRDMPVHDLARVHA